MTCSYPLINKQPKLFGFILNELYYLESQGEVKKVHHHFYNLYIYKLHSREKKNSVEIALFQSHESLNRPVLVKPSALLNESQRSNSRGKMAGQTSYQGEDLPFRPKINPKSNLLANAKIKLLEEALLTQRDILDLPIL
jgi:hypothetical protein